MEFKYIIQPPKKYTFEQPKLKSLVEYYCHGKVLNLFAGITKLNVDEIRVDINEETNPDYTMDAFDFVTSWDGELFDTIILDPPYNIRKAREKYNGRWIGKFRQIREMIPNIIKPNGHVITLGYNSVGIGRKNGFIKEAIILVCHNGDHNDTICVVEKFVQQTLFKKRAQDMRLGAIDSHIILKNAH